MQKHRVDNSVHFDVANSSRHVRQRIPTDLDALDGQTIDLHQVAQHGVLGGQRVQASEQNSCKSVAI